MDRWFDLHLYLTNWGTRQLSIRLPKRLVDRRRIDRFLMAHESASLRESGENLILDNVPSSDDPSDDWYPGGYWVDEDEEGWLTAMAPLRLDLLAGDFGRFDPIWLVAIHNGVGLHFGEDDEDDDDGWAYSGLDPAVVEPMAGIGPLTDALQVFATFFGLDGDLLAAASEGFIATAVPSPAMLHDAIAAIPAREQTALRRRLHDGDPRIATELRLAVRERLGSAVDPTAAGRRTVRELLVRSRKLGVERERAEERRAEAERLREAAEAEQARRARLVFVARRGPAVWAEVEREIERRNGPGYDHAANLLRDPQTIAGEAGTIDDFEIRVRQLRERRARKPRFIDRLDDL